LIPAGGSDLQGFGFRLPSSLSSPKWQFEPADKASWPQGLVVEPLWLHKSACRGLNRADDEAEYIWRYLRQGAPAGLAPGNLLVGALRMQADAGVPAGTYTGTLKLNDGGREVLSVPVSLRVPKVKLTDHPGKRLGIYYGNTLGGWGEKTARPADLVSSEMAEIRRNGGSIVFMSGKPKYIDERTMIRMQIAAGFPPPYIYDFNQVFKGCWTQKKEEVEHIIRQCKNPQFAEQVRAELAKLDEFEKELNIPRNSIVCTWGDEIQRYDTWMSIWTAYGELFRSLTDRRAAITAKMGAGHFFAKWEQMAPYADYFIFSGVRQDIAQKEVPEIIPQFMEILKKRPEVQFWSYYNNSDDDGLIARANAGLWLWRSPFTVTMPWTFNFYENSPFTDLDNATAQEDMVYACPDPDAPGHFASSLMWEGLREGFCDLRVAATLEDARASCGTERFARDRHPVPTVQRRLFGALLWRRGRCSDHEAGDEDTEEGEDTVDVEEGEEEEEEDGAFAAVNPLAAKGGGSKAKAWAKDREEDGDFGQENPRRGAGGERKRAGSKAGGKKGGEEE
jgi:hypothetical protein